MEKDTRKTCTTIDCESVQGVFLRFYSSLPPERQAELAEMKFTEGNYPLTTGRNLV